jgi:hypothetical protein
MVRRQPAIGLAPQLGEGASSSVPREGHERRDEIRRRSILRPDLRDDPAYGMNSPNWDTFSSWEYDPRRRAGYLGDVAF